MSGVIIVGIAVSERSTTAFGALGSISQMIISGEYCLQFELREDFFCSKIDLHLYKGLLFYIITNRYFSTGETIIRKTD